MDGQFKIKSYGYGELAMLYFPNSTKKSASVQFRKWIKKEPLISPLKNSGFTPGSKILTPKQVSIIVAHLGEP